MTWTHIAQAAEASGHSAGEFTQIWSRILSPEIIWVFIPIIAILCGSTISLVRRGHRHRERMAMIAAGLHPDFPPEEELDGLDSPASNQATMDYQPS